MSNLDRDTQADEHNGVPPQRQRDGTATPLTSMLAGR